MPALNHILDDSTATRQSHPVERLGLYLAQDRLVDAFQVVCFAHGHRCTSSARIPAVRNAVTTNSARSGGNSTQTFMSTSLHQGRSGGREPARLASWISAMIASMSRSAHPPTVSSRMRRTRSASGS